jgi:hypothetical protein
VSFNSRKTVSNCGEQPGAAGSQSLANSRHPDLACRTVEEPQSELTFELLDRKADRTLRYCNLLSGTEASVFRNREKCSELAQADIHLVFSLKHRIIKFYFEIGRLFNRRHKQRRAPWRMF